MSTSIEPGLLLAAPRMGDPNFEGTVVLLGMHDREGSLGWTLNGPPLDEAAKIVRATGLVPEGEELPATFARPARRGGPVSLESVWILYRIGEKDVLLPGSITVGTGLAVSAAVEALRMLMRGEGPKEFDLLVGYAGWGPGQLEREIAQGAWLPAPADASLLDAENGGLERLWRRAYEKTIGIGPEAFVSTTRGSA